MACLPRVLVVLALVLCAQSLKAGKWFDRIVIFQVSVSYARVADGYCHKSILMPRMQFENHSEKEVLADPNFSKFANQGRAMHNYFAVTHPSQPNYWYDVSAITTEGERESGWHVHAALGQDGC